MISSLHASPALQEWMTLFPEASAATEAKSKQITYGFYFKNSGLNIYLVLEASVEPEVMKPENYEQLMHEGVLSKPRLTVFAKSGKGAAIFELACSVNEFLELLNLIAMHEVFGTSGSMQPRFEPLPVILDSYTIVCVRNLGMQKSIVERESGLSIPVDHLVETLWGKMMKKMEALPDTERRRFVSLLPSVQTAPFSEKLN